MSKKQKLYVSPLSPFKNAKNKRKPYLSLVSISTKLWIVRTLADTIKENLRKIHMGHKSYCCESWLPINDDLPNNASSECIVL